MKKFLLTFLIASMVLSTLSISVFAEDLNDIPEKRESELKIIDEYNILYQRYSGDSERAIKELVHNSNTLTLVDNIKSSYTIKDGKPILYSLEKDGNIVYPKLEEELDVGLSSEMSDLEFNDNIVYDSDWNTYVYLGAWSWKGYHPNEDNLQPWDCIGFYTQDKDEVRAKEYILRGYSKYGGQRIYYNTDSGVSSGPVAKGQDTAWGAGFWHDETNVNNGTLSAPLYWTSGATAKVMMKYGHSWTDTNITGIGGSIGIDGAGFDISWDREVLHWSEPATSPGIRIR